MFPKGYSKSHALRGFLSNLRSELTWTHYKLIMRADTKPARDYYMDEAADQNWSTRQLERNINSLYYQRMLSTKKQELPLKQSPDIPKLSPADFVKDPYVLEFFGLPDN